MASSSFHLTTSSIRHVCTVQVIYVGFEVLTAVSTKTAVFWVVAPCILVQVYQVTYGMTSIPHLMKIITDIM
jgi:hypothetical protein